MRRDGPRFLDEPAAPEPGDGPRDEPGAAPRGNSGTAPRDEPGASSTEVERPRLYEALPDAPNAIGADWRPERVVPKPKRFGAGLVAVAGIALIIAGWLATSMTLVALSSFQVSPLLGDAVVAAFAVGGLLVLVAIGAEWRAMRSLRRVETVRSALRSSTTPVEELRGVALRWLGTLPGRLEVDPTVLEAVQRAGSADEIVSILKNRVGEKLTGETRRIGLRVATEGSLLVAISPHQSWDGIIVALYRPAHRAPGRGCLWVATQRTGDGDAVAANHAGGTGNRRGPVRRAGRRGAPAGERAAGPSPGGDRAGPQHLGVATVPAGHRGR